MKKFDTTKLTRSLGALKHGAQKNSPLILTILGVIGLGATAYLTYKSHDKLKAITDDLEGRRVTEERITELQNGEDLEPEEQQELETLQKDFKPIKRTEVVRDVAGAVAAPVLTGSLSVCAIALSYYIMNNRVLNLAASLATATAQNAYYDKKFKEEFGEKKYDEFKAQTEETEMTTTDKNGKDKTKKVKVQTRDLNLDGQWFDSSTEYASDDNAYNDQFIASKTQILQDKLFRDGFLLLNQARDELGFDRTRDGALIGWSAADDFDIFEKYVRTTIPSTNQEVAVPYVSWTKPKYIYDQIDYKNVLGYGM